MLIYEIKVFGKILLTELEKSVKSSIEKIKEENYKNYFIYAYNKDYYKNKTNKRKYTKRRTLKIYKN
jgi:hypothetical protein